LSGKKEEKLLMSAFTIPLISVVIVCWNNRKHLAQILPDFEIIIIDNG
jgi:glycosyltransferase involved in cell wall biosynthesis